MKATVLHSPGDVRVEEVSDAKIVESTDAAIRALANDDRAILGLQGPGGLAAHTRPQGRSKLGRRCAREHVEDKVGDQSGPLV
jgi:hypothetical protein